jgi:hypothetical protein
MPQRFYRLGWVDGRSIACLEWVRKGVLHGSPWENRQLSSCGIRVTTLTFLLGVWTIFYKGCIPLVLKPTLLYFGIPFWGYTLMILGTNDCFYLERSPWLVFQDLVKYNARRTVIPLHWKCDQQWEIGHFYTTMASIDHVQEEKMIFWDTNAIFGLTTPQKKV